MSSPVTGTESSFTRPQRRVGARPRGRASVPITQAGTVVHRRWGPSLAVHVVEY